MFLIIIFHISCSNTQIEIYPAAKNGILDLKDWDFKENGSIQLKGEWKFFWNKLDPSFAETGYDDSDWDTIIVPNYWINKINQRYGYACARLKVINLPQNECLGIFIMPPSTAYELYCNGELLLKNGIVGRDADTSVPQRIPLFLELDNNDELILTWYISNFHDRAGGPVFAPEIGLFEQIQKEFILNIYFNFTLFGIILMMSLYHFVLWLFLREDKASFFFSIFCFIMTVRIILFYKYIEQMFPAMYLFKFLIRMEVLTIPLALILFLNFIKEILPDEFSIRLYKIVLIISIIFMLINIFTPNWFISEYIFVYYLVLGFTCIWVIYMTIIALKNKRIGSVILLSGIIILFFTIMIDIIITYIPNISINATQIGTVMVLFSQSFILSKRFAKAYKTADHLSRNLTKEVALQTKIITEKNQELIRLNQEKTSYFINIAHETKTPLTLVSNYLKKYIQKKGMDPDLAVINTNIQKLKKNMNNFLDYEKLERGQDFYNHDDITDFSAVLVNAVRLFNETAYNKQIQINSDIKEKLVVKADPFAIDRIINNILDNAIKFTDKGGIINISLLPKDNEIEFIVKDNGIGIKAEQLENIFKSYYQISHEKRNVQGIGMGLNIVKKILDDIGAKIKVESSPDAGTVFKLYFKKVKGWKGKIESLSSRKAEYFFEHEEKTIPDNTVYAADKKTILIIEDNIDMLVYLKEELNGLYNVYCSQNGAEALLKLKSLKKVHIIISDIMMDVMDGYEFYNEFKKDENNESIPVIFLTAKNTQIERVKALKMGIIDYINKPFDIEELKAKIISIINITESQHERSKKELLNQVIASLNSSMDENDFSLMFENKIREHSISKREMDIIVLLLKGKQYKEIGEALYISINTVRSHVQKIYEKCKVNNKIELINLFKKQ